MILRKLGNMAHIHYPKGYWHSVRHQRLFLNSLSKELRITTQEQWYQVTSSTLIEHGGKPLLLHYNGSPGKLLMAVYPEYPNIDLLCSKYINKDTNFLIYKWDLSKFVRVPGGYWDDMRNQRSFMDNLAKTLQISNPEEWKSKLTKSVLYTHGGTTLLNVNYKGSVSRLLATVYPEYPSTYSLIHRSMYQWSTKANKPQGYWADVTVQRTFMEDLAKKLNIGDKEGWQTITGYTMYQHGAAGLLARYNNSMPKLLAAMYPEYPSNTGEY